MPPGGFDPEIPACEMYVLDRAAAAIGGNINIVKKVTVAY
jgi:hypothetical protein